MRIPELERAHGGFYVPAFVIKVGGEDVVRDLYLPVSKVTLDLKEKTAGRFTFTVVNAYDWDRGEFLVTRDHEPITLLELFAFGASVEIALGYGDAADLRPMLTGLITEVRTEFRSGSAPELTIGGYDRLYPLIIGKGTRHWEDKPDSTAVEDVVRRHRVPADVEATAPDKVRIDQNNETDMAFVLKLAARNDATFYHRDGRFYFGPRHNAAGAVAELTWGQGLLGFSAEASLERQIAEVALHGRSAARGEVITGRARKGDEAGRDSGDESGAERVVSALAAEPVLNIRGAVHTQAEADARARSVLRDRAIGFVSGNGESVGLPRILPDTNLTLTGLGAVFSKTYYVSGSTHTIDAGGYRTSFTVKEPTI